MGVAVSAVTESKAYAMGRCAVSQLIDTFRTTERLDEQALERLVHAATHPRPAVAKVGLHCLFRLFVEHLSDSFDPALARLYDMSFAQVIDHCRRASRGQGLRKTLLRFDIHSPDRMLARKRQHDISTLRDQLRRQMIECCVVPSRVTLGADIAVTTVVVHAILQQCPKARVLLLGDSRLAELFYGRSRVEILRVSYPASGNLFERLDSWCDAVALVDDAFKGQDARACLVVDPDSRITQLGLLPLAPKSTLNLHFASRSFMVGGETHLSTLSGLWLRERLGGDLRGPRIDLPTASRAFAAPVQSRLCPPGRPLVSVSLGVGGNDAKRLGLDFELLLLQRLMAVPATVLLFRGTGAEENARTAQLMAALRATTSPRIAVLSGQDPSCIPVESHCDLVTWQGPVGAYCALIERSQLHIGYDSCGQHAAAALGVPTIDIFADGTNPALETRWTPAGRAGVHVVRSYDQVDVRSVVDRALLFTERELTRWLQRQ